MVGVDLNRLPYRCPRCDEGNADFPTLKELSQHLALVHSYSRSKRERRYPTKPPDTSGRLSPLTKSFLRQRHLLEKQLKEAELSESQTHKQSQCQSQPSHIKRDLKDGNYSMLKSHTVAETTSDFFPTKKHAKSLEVRFVTSTPNPITSSSSGETNYDVTGQFDDITAVYPDYSVSGDQLSVETLTPTSRRAARRRKRHDIRHSDVTHITWSKQEMADKLIKARDHVDSLKHSADTVVQWQAVLIEKLRKELKGSDSLLGSARKELMVLHSDRQKLLIKVGKLSRDQDYNADSIAHLTGTLEEKDRCIEQKKREVNQLSAALHDVSKKECSVEAHQGANARQLTSQTPQHEKTHTSLRSEQNMTSHAPIAHWFPLPTTNTPTSSQTVGHGVAKPEQVNTYATSTLSYSTTHFGSTPHYAPPTLTTLPPATPPSSGVGGSPLHTSSTISDQSLLATSGYHSQNTGTTLSAVPNGNHSQKAVANGSNRCLSVNAQLANGRIPIEGFLSPLSPGEIVMNQPLWFKPRLGSGSRSGGRGKEQEGEEAELSDSQGSVSECERLPETLSSCLSKVLLRADRQEARPDPPARNQRNQPSADVTRKLHRRSALGESLPMSDNGLPRDYMSTRHGRTVAGMHLRPPVPKLIPSHWMHAPMTYVFQYLDTHDLCKVALVCHEWRKESRRPELWRTVCLQRSAIGSKFLVTISQWCTQLQSLTLKGLSGRDQRKHETSEQYKKAVRGSLEAGLEVLLEAAGEGLHSLRVIDCGNILTDRCLWLASCYSRLLERVVYISDSDPAGSEVIWALGAGCRNIHTFIIPPKYPSAHPRRSSDRCLTMAAACWPQLLVLCVGGVEISEKGLTAIAKTCTRLQVLELDHLCEVTEETAVSMCRHGLRGLQVLEFSSTPVTPHALLHFVSSCANLHTVRIKLSIADYYKDTQDAENQQQYHDVISKLQLVQSRSGMSDIIHIQDSRPTSWRK